MFYFDKLPFFIASSYSSLLGIIIFRKYHTFHANQLILSCIYLPHIKGRSQKPLSDIKLVLGPEKVGDRLSWRTTPRAGSSGTRRSPTGRCCERKARFCSRGCSRCAEGVSTLTCCQHSTAEPGDCHAPVRPARAASASRGLCVLSVKRCSCSLFPSFSFLLKASAEAFLNSCSLLQRRYGLLLSVVWR